MYIKPPPMYCTSELPTPQPSHFSGFQIQKALYGLKQAGRLWYKHLCDFLMDHNFSNVVTLPCIFVYRQGPDFVILAVYMDDINLIGTPATSKYPVTHLQSQFDMKLFGQTSLCLGLRISHLGDGSMFLHQTAYTRRILTRFQMQDVDSLAASMMGSSCTQQDPYTLAYEEEEELNKP